MIAVIYAAPAWGASGPGGATGGVTLPGRPQVASVACADGRSFACARGEQLALGGSALDGARRVLFLGGKGRADDRGAAPTAVAGDRLTVTVPLGARSGPLQVVTPAAGRSVPTARVAIVAAPAVTTPAGTRVFIDGQKPATFTFAPTAGAIVELVRLPEQEVVRRWPAVAAAAGTGEVRWDGELGGADAPVGPYRFRLTPGGVAASQAPAATDFTLLDHIFPIRARHDLERSATNGFGGGRGHQGQDMFARCGAPVVAARGGEVVQSAFQARAGNYVVVQRADGESYAYMHLRRAALVEKGDRVFTGQPLGEVGQTGRASGCHLHFERWTAPGWQAGGEPFDPLPELRSWDTVT